MAKGKRPEITLPKLDDLFSSQESREEESLSKIRDIPLEMIDDFPDHPFKVKDDEDMMHLVESVIEHGILVPAILRLKQDGRYELIAGHRRKEPASLPGLKRSGRRLWIWTVMRQPSIWWTACARKARGLGTHATRVIVDFALRKQ